MLFVRIAGGETASGKNMPQMEIYRSQGDRHTYLEASRDTYTRVVAHWRDPRKVLKKRRCRGDRNAKHLRGTYADEQDALEAAVLEWERLRRGEASMRFSMAARTPQLTPQLTPQYVI